MLKPKKNKYKNISPLNKFALLICAHNEEKVICRIVQNLKELNYPKRLYDIYAICDNCNDSTAEIAEHSGATVMERNEPDKKSKGYGLEWMFERLWEFEKKGISYDAIVIFDADNLVDLDFLNIMNSRLFHGDNIIQGYLGCKNPKDNWITKSYAFSYWSSNRVYQLSREKINLSAQLGGTGIVIKKEILKKISWKSHSLTEDLEFTIKYILKTGDRVHWAHNARIYDEKPISFKASCNQRLRWMMGHISCMLRYSKDLILSFFKKKKLIYFDAFIYLIRPSRVVLVALLWIMLIFSFFDYSVLDLSNTIFSNWLWIAIIIIFHLIPIIGLILDKKNIAILWWLKMYVFSISWIPVTLLAFFKNKNKTWVHTKHDRSLKIQDIKD